ncbi:hypothetical protein ASF71_19180 [Deinococcus sp. Leaf326]|nr:hypothetical protein ASF71_19180 [Deinococcus sp. Leaf326]
MHEEHPILHPRARMTALEYLQVRPVDRTAAIIEKSGFPQHQCARTDTRQVSTTRYGILQPPNDRGGDQLLRKVVRIKLNSRHHDQVSRPDA